MIERAFRSAPSIRFNGGHVTHGRIHPMGTLTEIERGSWWRRFMGKEGRR